MFLPSFSDTCYHFCEGLDATSYASFGEAVHIAVTLHMHEEASYKGLDPIESEVRRRVFWLLFGGRSSPPLSSSALFEGCSVDAPHAKLQRTSQCRSFLAAQSV